MREEVVKVLVREFEPERDREAVEILEKSCEVGPSGKMALFTDLLGDPLCRVRHSPCFFMLVAETCGPLSLIVGVVRGCIKTVTCGKKANRSPSGEKQYTPIYTKLAYLLGLRVSPAYRRMGIGLTLVQNMEQWFRSKGAEYSYIATDTENEASVRLFTRRSGYTKFRTPSILVHPVFRHPLPLHHRRIKLLRLSPSAAELLYRRRLSTTEFFPRDIGSILRNKLSLGTFLALPSDHPWTDLHGFLAAPPDSWAVLSVWNCKALFRLEVRGAGRWRRWLSFVTRVVDGALPCLGIPSVPDVFRPFGMYLMYGIEGEGKGAEEMVRVLCRYVHNLGREGGCKVVVAEVGEEEPLRKGIPYWRGMSCAEDLWCVKRLGEDYSDGAVGDWTKAAPGKSIFVDPREF
ncbi:probable N-acetyltransferase HLS1-like [Phalaenopsis equestris]|uniref:probable N-acetyltransferase HLS1-like n=1 Tax=Phalaenopsis equestris TaxID=78828 RepID=UPI0009E56D19|nr:probable N-acetyltransferase HLS1-like [Phalaenopsis equestris]